MKSGSPRLSVSARWISAVLCFGFVLGPVAGSADWQEPPIVRSIPTEGNEWVAFRLSLSTSAAIGIHLRSRADEVSASGVLIGALRDGEVTASVSSVDFGGQSRVRVSTSATGPVINTGASRLEERDLNVGFTDHGVLPGELTLVVVAAGPSQGTFELAADENVEIVDVATGPASDVYLNDEMGSVASAEVYERDLVEAGLTGAAAQVATLLTLEVRHGLWAVFDPGRSVGVWQGPGGIEPLDGNTTIVDAPPGRHQLASLAGASVSAPLYYFWADVALP